MDSNSHFPGSRTEALALEYVKLHISESNTPEEICAIYLDAYSRISEAFKANRQARNG